MKSIPAIHPRLAGFTLVEMAIVLFIVALLLGGLVPTLSGQIEQKRVNETRKQLDEIQQALLGYAISNGRLPCPADGTIPAGQPNAGQEATLPGPPKVCANVVGNNAIGVLPWATLGVNETDAWGWRYTYQVTATWADNTDGASPTISPGCNITVGVSFQLCSNPNLNILAAATGTSIASNIPAVVASHGKNGYGAYTTNGGARQAASSDADEAENSDGDVNFVSKLATPTFDDLVVWISPNVLFNRMVAAGKLP